MYFRSPTLVGPPLHQCIETVTIFKCSNWIPPWTRIHMLATNIPQATIKFKTSRNPQSFNHDPSLRSQGIDGQSLLSCLPRALPRCVFSRITELELPYVHFKKPNDAVRFVRSFPDAEKCTYVTLKDDHAPDAVGLHPRWSGSPSRYSFSKFYAKKCDFKVQLEFSLVASAARERLGMGGNAWSVIVNAVSELFSPSCRLIEVVLSERHSAYKL